MSRDDNSMTESELAERARMSVDKHVLPDEVQRKLRLARAAAVAQLETPSSRAGALFGEGRWLLPAGGAAAALALAVVLNQNASVPLLPALEEQELAAATEMDMLEDIEFLAWMLEEGEGDLPDDG